MSMMTRGLVVDSSRRTKAFWMLIVNIILYDGCSLIQRVKELLLFFTNGFSKFFEKFWVVFLQNIDVRF